RGFASGQISLSSGAIAAVILLSTGLAVAHHLSLVFLGITSLYLAITLTYSYLLKRYVLIDVITLSFLYTLRVLAGAVAIDVDVSAGLLAFSIFVFLSLALVKRASELV